MMKNFMPSIIAMMAYLIIVSMFSLLLLHFSSPYDFFLYIGMMVIIYVICYSIGYGLIYAVTRIVDGIKKRRYKRFIWYYNMGLIESVLLVEPKYARNYSKNYWMRFFK